MITGSAIFLFNGAVSDPSPGRPTYNGTKAEVCSVKTNHDTFLKPMAVTRSYYNIDNHAWGGQVATEQKFGLRPETDPMLVVVSHLT